MQRRRSDDVRNPKKNNAMTNQRDTKFQGDTKLLITGLLHLDQPLDGQHMLARTDALERVRWTCA